VLRAVGELERDGFIADETWAVLVEHLDARQVLDVIFTAGAYATIAWMVEHRSRRRPTRGHHRL